MLASQSKADSLPGSTGYHRFHIETREAPHAFPVPNKFDVSANKIRLAAMLVHETVHYRFNKEVVLSRPCIYGVFGGRLGGFKPIKAKCVGCMRCVQEYPHIMNVRPSEKYKSLGDACWTPESVFTILYESSTGKIPIKGMGYKGGFGGEGWDGIWTDMSEIVRPTRDGVYGREYISTTVDIGRRPQFLEFTADKSLADATEKSSDLLRSPLPIVFEEVTEKSWNTGVEDAISTAATRLGLYHASTSWLSQGKDRLLVPLVSKENFDQLRDRPLELVEFDAASSLPGFAKSIRKESPSVQVAARLGLDESTGEKAVHLVRDEEVDVVHLLADYHGFDYSRSPRHVSDSLKSVHTRLVDEGLRDSTTLIVSGGITLAEHVPKAIICGADMVGLDTTLLVALQSEFTGETRDRTECGIRSRKIDPVWGAQRIVNLMASWHDQLIEILSAMGMRDVRRLRGDVGRSMTDHELREQAFREIVKA